ncbi:MAG: histidine phosphatase family protein [Anaerovoracaceae bacterium]|jgi:broad specificity phosphatase PhoE/CTP:molybdopterin cytidylyltransferase MocA
MIGAVIIASGIAAKSGKIQSMLDVCGFTAAERAVKAISGAGIENIVIVTGKQRELALPLINKYGLTEVYDSSYSKGLMSQLAKGMEAMAELGAEGFLFTPGGYGGLRRDTVKMLLDRQREIEEKAGGEGKEIVVPMFYGKSGAPVYVPTRYKGEIKNLKTGQDLRDITTGSVDHVHYIETHDKGTILNTYTDRGLRELRRFVETGSQSPDIRKAARGRRFILVRRAEVEKPEEKVFFGQANFRLSAEGAEHARKTGQRMQKMNIRTDHIYSSDLLRAGETAEIIREISPVLRLVIYDKAFREISRGQWDSKVVSVVREAFPDEFEARERNLFKYRVDAKSENYFDVQYRVMDALHRILRDDSHKDIAIVSHSVVMRVIEGTLIHDEAEAPWVPPAPCEIREFTVK